MGLFGRKKSDVEKLDDKLRDKLVSTEMLLLKYSNKPLEEYFDLIDKRLELNTENKIIQKSLYEDKSEALYHRQKYRESLDYLEKANEASSFEPSPLKGYVLNHLGQHKESLKWINENEYQKEFRGQKIVHYSKHGLDSFFEPKIESMLVLEKPREEIHAYLDKITEQVENQKFSRMLNTILYSKEEIMTTINKIDYAIDHPEYQRTDKFELFRINSFEDRPKDIFPD